MRAMAPVVGQGPGFGGALACRGDLARRPLPSCSFVTNDLPSASKNPLLLRVSANSHGCRPAQASPGPFSGGPRGSFNNDREGNAQRDSSDDSKPSTGGPQTPPLQPPQGSYSSDELTPSTTGPQTPPFQSPEGADRPFRDQEGNGIPPGLENGRQDGNGIPPGLGDGRQEGNGLPPGLGNGGPERTGIPPGDTIRGLNYGDQGDLKGGGQGGLNNGGLEGLKNGGQEGSGFPSGGTIRGPGNGEGDLWAEPVSGRPSSDMTTDPPDLLRPTLHPGGLNVGPTPSSSVTSQGSGFSSSVFSDIEDAVKSSQATPVNGSSWGGGPPRPGGFQPGSPDGLLGAQRASGNLGRHGPSVKGIRVEPRGRQSVLGSAVMQGSRFEPGHGDTSWINSMAPDWFPVIPVWQATEKAAMASEPFLNHMSQGWRVLLLSDGSVTRHLHLMTGHRVSVECLEMRAIGHSLLGVPPGTALVAGPRVQRQVLLKTQDGTPLAYAASWWAEYEAKMHLTEAHTPIWLALQEQRMELFRNLECLYYGHSRELEQLFGRSGPFWARHYLFYHNGRPLTLIYEVFSPALDEWLGDSDLPEDLYLP